MVMSCCCILSVSSANASADRPSAAFEVNVPTHYGSHGENGKHSKVGKHKVLKRTSTHTPSVWFLPGFDTTASDGTNAAQVSRRQVSEEGPDSQQKVKKSGTRFVPQSCC